MKKTTFFISPDQEGTCVFCECGCLHCGVLKVDIPLQGSDEVKWFDEPCIRVEAQVYTTWKTRLQGAWKVLRGHTYDDVYMYTDWSVLQQFAQWILSRTVEVESTKSEGQFTQEDG